MNTLVGLLSVATTLWKISGFLVQRVQSATGGKTLPPWVQQVFVLLLGVGAAFLFQMNALSLVAASFGGHIASVTPWAAMLLTGIGLAAVADGAAQAINTAAAVLSKGTVPVQQSKRLW